MKQHTLKKSAKVKGVGLHTGQETTMTFKPAEEDFGFQFKRVDLEGEPVVAALVANVISTQRGTTIKKGEAQVSTIEHTLSALVGLGIDNCLIEIDGPEAPILDGSSILIINALKKAGKKEQEKDCEFLEIEESVVFRDEATGTELLALPSDDYEVTTMIDFNSPVLGKQYAELKNLEDYEKEIAPCRTFVFLHEIETLADAGLIKGGDLDNAVVIANRAMSEKDLEKLAKKIGRPSVKVDKEGILNTTDLRFQNEPARHKLLDVVGDLALLGCRIKGRIVALKPGHTANVEFAGLLKKYLSDRRKMRGIPKYDVNAEPVLSGQKVYEILPHRFPFQLVDKIIDLTQTTVVGVKNVSYNEPFFQGHFPGNPVMPGVLQTEAMAQTGGVLALTLQDDPYGWDTYFLKLNNVKFKKMVVPGDTLIIKCELLGPIRRGIVQMSSVIYVGNSVVSEAELTARIVKRK